MATKQKESKESELKRLRREVKQLQEQIAKLSHGGGECCCGSEAHPMDIPRRLQG